MKLSEKMTARLVALLGENAHEYVAKKNQPTYAALERRGLIEWGERRIGSSYSIRLTGAGRALAEELRGDQAETAPGEDEDDYANVMFPADMARVRAAYPVGTHVTGVSRRGERAGGLVTGYAQSGSPRDGYRTAVEIEHADGTGEYTLINAEDVDVDGAEVEGRVIAHQGAGRGVAPEHADNPAARAAIFTLTNAGFTPVTVNGEFDPTPGDGTTGFYTEVRYADTPDEIVYVHDVLDGKLTWRRDADSKLSDYAKALADAGWTIPNVAARVVRALPPVEAEPSIVFEPGPNRIGGAHERRWSIGGRPSRDRAEARNILTDRYGWALEDAEQALEDSARHHAR